MKKLIILGVLVLLSPIITVKAEYKIHDGRPFGNPIMDSGATPRYTDKDIKYYDVAIPYDTPLTELGGYATGVSISNYKGSPSDYSTSKHLGTLTSLNGKPITESGGIKSYYIHYDYDAKLYSTKKLTEIDYGLPEPTGVKQYGRIGAFGNNNGLTHRDLVAIGTSAEDGWNQLKDKAGNLYNLGALGQGMLANKDYGWSDYGKPDSEFSKKFAETYTGDKAKGENPNWRYGGVGGSGLLFDLLLKDGTQIHCALSDTMGKGHSYGNGATGQDGLWFFGGDKSDYMQYKHFWYIKDPFHLVEAQLNNSKELSKWGVSESNPICYVRVWNTTLWEKKDTGLPVASNMTGAKSKVDTPSSTIINGDNEKNSSGSTSGAGGSGSGTPATPNGQFMGGIISEDSLVTVNKLTEVDIHGLFLEDAKEENLEQEELEGLVTWKRNIKSNTRENGIYKWARIIMVWFGLLFILWGTLLYIAYWVDRVNGIYFFNFVGILTLGKLQISDTEEECTYGSSGESKTKTINHRVVIFISLLSIFFGGMIITGYIYSILSYIIHKIISILS